jgi:hypothetical protein
VKTAEVVSSKPSQSHLLRRASQLLVGAGTLLAGLTHAGTSHAVTGMFRIAPQNAPQKSFDLPGNGCPYNAGNTPNSLSLYSHDNLCGNGDQRWYVVDVGGGQHEIRQGGAGGKCLDIDNAGNSTNLGTYTCTGGSNQRWWFQETTGAGTDGLYGLWKITSVRDGRAIDLANGTTSNGTKIQVWTSNDSAAQRWILWGNGGMHPDFEDDFNGSGLNTGNWTAASFGAGRFNSESQNYAPDKVTVSNGMLHIDASYNAGCNGSTGWGCYQSGRITSKGKQWKRNGMFTARIHYYEGGSGGVKGTWPAWWILGNNINEDPYNGANVGGQCWPLSTAREIDIWEWVRNNNGSGYINNGIISNGGCNSAVHQSSSTWAWNWNDWVIASVKIDGGRVKFYRGGVKTHDIPDSGLVNEDFAFVLNLAVGGMLGGSSQDFNGTDDWASIEVDYVTHEVW